MANELMISEGKLIKLDQKYMELSHNARMDKTYVSDYQAAFHAPAAFLQNPSNFEATFDKIIFHLDSAFKKATDSDEKALVSRVSEELFNDHIFIIQERIEQLKAANSKGFLEKLFDGLSKIGDKIPEMIGMKKGEAAAKLSAEAVDLFKAYFYFLTTKWQLDAEECFFYNQLASVYAKILDSACFSNEFGLLRNAFTRNKEDILGFTVQEKGLTAALNLTKYDRTSSELMDSARIITRTLSSLGDWGKLVDFMQLIKEKNLANYKELKREATVAFKENACPQKKLIPWIGKGSIAALIGFLGTVYYKFTTAQAVTGFWNTLWSFITTAVSAIYLAICAAIGAVLLVYVIAKLISLALYVPKVKKYEKLLGQFTGSL